MNDLIELEFLTELTGKLNRTAENAAVILTGVKKLIAERDALRVENTRLKEDYERLRLQYITLASRGT